MNIHQVAIRAGAIAVRQRQAGREDGCARGNLAGAGADGQKCCDDERGKETNLKAYLKEVREYLLPILDPTFIQRKAQS